MVAEDPDFDDFLARVENVSQTVNKLVRGEISPDECDAISAKIELQRLPPPEPARYRAGSGNADQYAVYCRRCGIEHDDDVMNCAICHRSDALETRQQRQTYLKGRVQKLMAERDDRAQRRQRWQRYRETRLASKRGETDFERWQVWEPDSDSDDEPIPDRNDPRFAALDADIRRREDEVARKRHQADEFKAEGNACFAAHRYVQACDLYTKAIELKKDQPAYYTNRALAYLHTDQYQLALADCDAVLDMAEFFDGNRHKKHDSFVQKAWLRRAMALHGLLRFDEAIESLKDGALVCAPADSEAVALLKQYEEDRDEYVQERRLRSDAEYDGFRALVKQFRAGDDVASTMLDGICELGVIGRILFRSLKGLTFALELLPKQTAVIVPLLIAASTDNDRSLHYVAKPKHINWVTEKLQERQLNDQDVLALCQLLLHLCQLETVRKHVTARFEGDRLWRVMNNLLRRPGNDECKIAAMGVVGSCASVAPFRRAIRTDSGGADLHQRLVVIVSSKSASDQLKERALYTLSNVLLDNDIRKRLATINDSRVFQVLVGTLSVVWKRVRRQAVVWYGQDALLYALNIILNLSSEPVALQNLIAADLLMKVTMLIAEASSDIRQRSLQIVTRCSKIDSAQEAMLQTALPVIYDALKDDSCREHSIRALAAISRQTGFIEHLYRCRSDKNVRERFVELVCSSNDNQLVGNICLCISKCIDSGDESVIIGFEKIIPRLAEILLNSDVNQAIRRNVAITMAKMSRIPEVLNQLRKLRVLECMLATAQGLLN